MVRVKSSPVSLAHDSCTYQLCPKALFAGRYFIDQSPSVGFHCWVIVGVAASEFSTNIWYQIAEAAPFRCFVKFCHGSSRLWFEACRRPKLLWQLLPGLLFYAWILLSCLSSFESCVLFALCGARQCSVDPLYETIFGFAFSNSLNAASVVPP